MNMDNLNDDNSFISEKCNDLPKINESNDIILPNVLLSSDYKCEKNLSCCELLEQRKFLVENKMNISPEIFKKPGEFIPDKFNGKLSINHSLENILMNNFRTLLKSKFRRVTNKMEDFQRAKENLNNIKSVFKYWRYSKNKYIVKIINFCKFSKQRKSFYKWERLIKHQYFKEDVINKKEKNCSNKFNDISDSLEQYKKINIKKFHTDFINERNIIHQNDNFETLNNNYILNNYINFNKDVVQKHLNLIDGKINNLNEIEGNYKKNNIKTIKIESPEKKINNEGNIKLNIININFQNKLLKQFNNDNKDTKIKNLNNINNKINKINENYNRSIIKNIKPDISSEKIVIKKNNEIIDLMENIYSLYNNEKSRNNKITNNNFDNIFRNIENKNNNKKYITKDNINNKLNKNYFSNKENINEKNKNFEKQFLKNFIKDKENSKNKDIYNKSFDNEIINSYKKKFIKMINNDKENKKESKYNKNHLNDLNQNYKKVIKSINIDNKSNKNNNIIQKFKNDFNLIENDYLKKNIKQFKNDIKDNSFNFLEKNKNYINELNQNYRKGNIKEIKHTDPQNVKLKIISKIKFVDNDEYNKQNNKKFHKDIVNNKKEKFDIDKNMFIQINNIYKTKNNRSFTPDKHNIHNISNMKLNLNNTFDNNLKINNFKKNITLSSTKINVFNIHNNIIKKFKIDIPSERIDEKLKNNKSILIDDNYKQMNFKNLKEDIPNLRNKNYNVKNISINSIEKDYSNKILKTINFDLINSRNNINKKDIINLNSINLNYKKKNILSFSEEHCDKSIRILNNDNKSFNLIVDYFEKNKIQKFEKDKSNYKIKEKSNNIIKFDSFIKEHNSLYIKKIIKEKINNKNKIENKENISEIKEIYQKKYIKTINLNKTDSKLNDFHLKNDDFNLIEKEHNSIFNKSFIKDKSSKSFSLPNNKLHQKEFNDIQNDYNKIYIKKINKDCTPEKLKIFNKKNIAHISEFGFILNNNNQELQKRDYYSKNFIHFFSEDKINKNMNNINNLNDEFDNLNKTYNFENIKPFMIDNKNKFNIPCQNKNIITNINDKYLNQNHNIFKIDESAQKLKLEVKNENKIHDSFYNLIKRFKKDLIDKRQKKLFNNSMDKINTKYNLKYSKFFNQDEKINKSKIIFNTLNINKIDSLNISQNIKHFKEDNKDINLNQIKKSNKNVIDLLYNSNNIKDFKIEQTSDNLKQFNFNKTSINNIQNEFENFNNPKEDINFEYIEKSKKQNFKVDIKNPHINQFKKSIFNNIMNSNYSIKLFKNDNNNQHINQFENSTFNNILNSYYSIKQFKKDNNNQHLNQFEKSKSIIENQIKQFLFDSSSPRLFINNLNILYDNIENLNNQYNIQNIKIFKEDCENFKLNITNNNNDLNKINQKYIKINYNLFNNSLPNTKINNSNITNLQISLKEIVQKIKNEEKKKIMKKMSEKLPFKPSVKNSLEEIQKKFFAQFKIKKFKLDKNDNQLNILEKRNNRLNSFKKLNLINHKFKEYEESKMKIISKKIEKKKKKPPDFAIYLKAIIDKNSNKISPEERDYLNSIYQEMLLKIFNVDDENNLENVIKGYEEIINIISIILLSLKIQMDYIPESYFDKFKKYNENVLSNNDNKIYLEYKKNNMKITSKFKFLISQYKELGIKERESSIKFKKKIYITAFLLSFISVIFFNIIWNN